MQPGSILPGFWERGTRTLLRYLPGCFRFFVGLLVPHGCENPRQPRVCFQERSNVYFRGAYGLHPAQCPYAGVRIFFTDYDLLFPVIQQFFDFILSIRLVFRHVYHPDMIWPAIAAPTMITANTIAQIIVILIHLFGSVSFVNSLAMVLTANVTLPASTSCR